MQTAAEVKAISAMLADGRALRNFERLTGETALVHRRPSRHGLEFATKITAEGLTTWLGWPQTYEALERLVRESGVPAILAAHLVIGAVLEDGKATYALDDLIKEIGWTPHSSAERDKMRAQVWYWHVIWNSTPVIGARRRTYTDRDTHQKIPTVSREPLLLIRSTQLPEQRAFDATAVPLEVTMEAGEPLEAQRANPELRAVWGSVRKLSGIPGKQASGAWAQAIGLALFQRWREEASRAEVRRVGEDNHVTVKFAPFTRRQLLTLFPPDPTLDHVLSDQRQRRAVMYWNGAIKMLKKRKVIGFFQEPVFQPPSRQGWTDAWLDEPLDIRPTHEDMRNAEIIKRSALRIRKGAPRPRSAVPR